MPLPGSGVRLLDTTAPGTTPLTASRLLVPDTKIVSGAAGIRGAKITPDGSFLYVALQPIRGKNTWRIAQFSGRTGKLLHLTLSTSSGSGPGPCEVDWTDASGRHLRAECGSVAATVDNGIAHPVSPPWGLPQDSTPDPAYYAW